MSFLGSIIGDIFEGIANSIISFLTNWLALRAAKKQGAQDQAAAETAQSLQTETKIAKAEADAPKNIDDAIQRAKDGTL